MEELKILITDNHFRESVLKYRELDPDLNRLKSMPMLYTFPTLDKKFIEKPGIYYLVGRRFSGKTTFLKLMILDLLLERTNPEAILFVPGKRVETHYHLRTFVKFLYKKDLIPQYLIIDDINYLPEWYKSFIFMQKLGFFTHTVVILTTSDSQDIETAKIEFTLRIGTSDHVVLAHHPLSFTQFVCFKEKSLEPFCNQIMAAPLTEPIADWAEKHEILTELFYEYLLHGGYLSAINEYYSQETISNDFMNPFVQWIMDDMFKHIKRRKFSKDVFNGIKMSYNTPFCWEKIGKDLSIKTKVAIAKYFNMLESVYVLHLQEALQYAKLIGSSKKNRKIYFCDPFIDHAISCYLNPELSFDQIKRDMKDNQFASSHVITTLIDHCKRWIPTYYINVNGDYNEIDIALIQDSKIFPVQVKWEENIQVSDIKEDPQFDNKLLLIKGMEHRKIKNTHVVPLIRFLIHTSSLKLVI